MKRLLSILSSLMSRWRAAPRDEIANGEPDGSEPFRPVGRSVEPEVHRFREWEGR